ncbi:glycosyltransferase [Flavobacteriaceae bacterium]|nr:glycosyltransferase [Flavobacteriaceae bacterium]
MTNKNTDFFEKIDNFKKTEDVESIIVINSDLDYTPKVTIAIPTFKRADLLKQALDSALNQNQYSSYDILVIDNDPMRNCATEKLLKKYKDPKISYYKNSSNIKMIGNWNRLFSLSKGKYVAILHDDDYLLPNFLEEGMKILEKNEDIDLLKPNSLDVECISDFDVKNMKSRKYKIKRIHDISFYYGHIIGAPTGIFYKKKSVVEIGGFNQDLFPSSDYCFHTFFSMHYKVYQYNQILSLYRIGFNESFQEEVLHGWAITDFYLITQLLNKYKFSKYLILKFLRHRIKNTTEEHKKLWNKNFNFNMNELDLNEIHPLLGKFYHSLIFLYVQLIIVKRNYF